MVGGNWSTVTPSHAASIGYVDAAAVAEQAVEQQVASDDEDGGHQSDYATAALAPTAEAEPADIGFGVRAASTRSLMRMSVQVSNLGCADRNHVSYLLYDRTKTCRRTASNR